MNLKGLVQRTARKLGYDVVYFDRMRLLKHFGINLVFDVGANVGQYGTEMRSLGYSGRIVSFEPLTREFQILLERKKRDTLWKADNRALGDRDGAAEIHVSGNSQSSSLLDMLPRHVQAAPLSQYVGSETIQTAQLDTVFRNYYQHGDRALLKLDTQGYEYNVLRGATASLPFIIGIQIEMSLVPLYSGEKGFSEMVSYLTNLGFALMSIEPVYRDKAAGQMLVMDGIFYRDGAEMTVAPAPDRLAGPANV